eukprot:TRINITY_DN7104_c0_g1_i4.p1 TRINITY_DN7104_c0_g1~~TRINITY_DN7104_c0_g1_i4.p1  ORF type:complete len:294 (-),score=25.36 TRINITY_DN7104_c0_g1_i4:35-916(-)
MSYFIYYSSNRNVRKLETIKDFESGLNYLEQAMNKSNLINDLKLVTGEKCPAGYDRVNLGSWPGNQEGCLCSQERIEKLSCNDWNSQIRYRDCYSPQTVVSLDPILLNRWSDFIICKNRTEANDWDIAKDKKCQPDKVLCEDDATCARYPDGCPITNITWDLRTKKLITSKSVKNSSFYDLKISIGGPFCPKYRKIPIRDFSYPLIEDEGCEIREGITAYLFKVAETTEEKLYQDNQIFDKLHKNLPFYDVVMKMQRATLYGLKSIRPTSSVAGCDRLPVSYTHLTLPTIYSV